MSVFRTGWLQQQFPFLFANWPWTVCVLLLAILIHLRERKAARGKMQAVRENSQPASAPERWHDESVSDDASKETEHEGEDPSTTETEEHVPYKMEQISAEEMVRRSEAFYKQLSTRRSVRFFSAEPVPREVVVNAIRAAASGPSGAHTQPWTFVLVSSNAVKSAVRDIIEEEEEVNYKRRMGQKWVEDLKFIACNWKKEYLTTAPYLILVFRHAYGLRADGSRFTTYYNEISCNLACGLLLSALHAAGLGTLTSTPLNCGPRLRRLLERPDNEKLVLLLPVGRPAPDCTVPNISRKPLDQVLVEK